MSHNTSQDFPLLSANVQKAEIFLLRLDESRPYRYFTKRTGPNDVLRRGPAVSCSTTRILTDGNVARAIRACCAELVVDGITDDGVIWLLLYAFDAPFPPACLI